MNGQDFLRICNTVYAPFLKELGFSMNTPAINGRFYSVAFTGASHAISLSCEPGDEAFFVMIFGQKNGE
jgi:hypothetical protein